MWKIALQCPGISPGKLCPTVAAGQASPPGPPPVSTAAILGRALFLEMLTELVS